MPRRSILALMVSMSLSLTAVATQAQAGSITLEPSKDNTLYQDALGAISNGSGAHMFTGQVLSEDLRRGLVAFDIAGNLPPGTTVTGATLQLYMSKTHPTAGSSEVSLHRAIADWGEGASDAPEEEGEGDNAVAPDATWLHREFNTIFWSEAGGDFAATPTAGRAVDQIGHYVWASTPAMVADVQGWLDEPATNFGWVIVGDESATAPTAKRFDTREEAVIEYRPKLTVEFASGVPTVSTWGVTAMIVVLLTAGTIAFRRLRPA